MNPPNKMIQIQWTAPSLEEAKKIAGELVEKKWIACANLLPHVESIFLWEGKVCHEQEVKVFFKTTDPYFSKVKDYITDHGSYDVPEVSKIHIAECNPDYLDWLVKSLG